MNFRDFTRYFSFAGGIAATLLGLAAIFLPTTERLIEPARNVPAAAIDAAPARPVPHALAQYPSNEETASRRIRLGAQPYAYTSICGDDQPFPNSTAIERAEQSLKMASYAVDQLPRIIVGGLGECFQIGVFANADLQEPSIASGLLPASDAFMVRYALYEQLEPLANRMQALIVQQGLLPRGYVVVLPPGSNDEGTAYFLFEDLGLSHVATMGILPPNDQGDRETADCNSFDCLVQCYLYDSVTAGCPSRAEQVARLFREGHAAYRDPPRDIEIGVWSTVVFTVTKEDVPVTPETEQRRIGLMSAGSAPQDSDNSAVRAAREVTAPDAAPEVSTEGIAVAPFVSARLVAPSFEVVAATQEDARRSCRVGTECTWTWRIRALSPGERTLSVELLGHLSDAPGGSAEPVSVHRHNVHVQVTATGLARVAWEYIQRNWLIALGALASLATVMTFLLQRRQTN